MKKFLPLLLAVCLVFALAFNVSASSLDDVEYFDRLIKDGKGSTIWDYFSVNPSHNGFMTNDDYLTFVGGPVVVSNNSLRCVEDNSRIELYKYDWADDEWRYVATDYYDSGSVVVSNVSTLVWSKDKIVDDKGILVFDGDPSFQMSYSEALDESLDKFNNDFVSVVRVLLTVGLAIMAVFVGVSLVPRIIHKFL